LIVVAMEVQVVSPERILYSGEAVGVLARTLEGGDIAFLPGHAPFIGALAIHPITVHPEEGADVVVAVHGGFVEVSGNRVTILSDVAELAEHIDLDRAHAAKASAEAALVTDAESLDAKAALARAVTRVAVHQGHGLSGGAPH
jgi:F-type H+-transporting ATPase subunit epsilon